MLGLEELDRYHMQRYLGERVRVSKTAVWMKRDLSTHEWQVALVQVLERLQGFERQGKPALSSGWNTKNENRTQIFLIKLIRKIR